MIRGRKTKNVKLEHVRNALQLRDDPIALEGSPLADMRIVRSRAQSQFARRTCGTGLALSAVLHEVLARIATDLGGQSTLSCMAAMLEAGATQASIARAVGLSTEHLSRHWKPILLKLVLERLESMNGDVSKRSLATEVQAR